MSRKDPAEKAIRDIRRKTRKRYSAEEKIRIVLSGLRGEESIAELCRREGIAQSIYYKWSKEFLEAGMRASGTNERPWRHLTPTPEPYSHGPCAVIAEPRRLASKPFDQNPAQAPA